MTILIGSCLILLLLWIFTILFSHLMRDNESAIARAREILDESSND